MVSFCPMAMPKLPGDMFYLAVQRTNPHLCDRFIFMTGHRADAKIVAFLHKVSGLVLLKPFELRDLMTHLQIVQHRVNRQRGIHRSKSPRKDTLDCSPKELATAAPLPAIL